MPFVLCWAASMLGFAQKADGPASLKVSPVELAIDLGALPQIQPWQPGDPLFEYRHEDDPAADSAPQPVPSRTDPLLEIQAGIEMRPGGVFGTPNINVPGQTFNGANPPDTNGDVGMTYFIQATNGQQVSYTVFHKVDGSVAAGPFALAPFLPCGNRGDPVVKYDALAQRWILASLGVGNSLCVLVSKTGNPISGGWWAYGFPTPNVPDFPKIAVWNHAYFVTSNEPGGSPIYALERDAMLRGKPAGIQRFEVPDLPGFTFQALTPADVIGNQPPPEDAPGIFLRPRDIEIHGSPLPGKKQDLIERFELFLDWKDPSQSRLDGPFYTQVSPFDATLCRTGITACIPQPAGPGLDPHREVIAHRLVYRNFGDHQAIVGNFSHDVDGTDHAGIRWFELRRVKSGEWGLHQEGTLAPDADHRWLGAIAIDGNGNIALAYNVASDSQSPSIRYAGRRADDPLGVLTEGEHILADGAGSNVSSRYGDYASMSVDPADDCTFWLTGTYNPTSLWATRIAGFAFNPGPKAPAGLKAETQDDNRIDLSWTPVKGATSYNVFRQIGTCPAKALEPVAMGLKSTEFSDFDVSGGYTYTYAVRYFRKGTACGSALSTCVSATAKGECRLPPTFDGLEKVVNVQKEECRLELSWSPPVFSCPKGISYNVYRDIQSGFSPSPETMIAACIQDPFYSDFEVQSGVEYFYIVRAEDHSGFGDGPCIAGNEDTNTVEKSARVTGPFSKLNLPPNLTAAFTGTPCAFTCTLNPGHWPILSVLQLADCINHLP